MVFSSDDTPHVPNERLGEAAVLAIVDRLTRLIREVFPGKTLSLVPLKQFLKPQAVSGTVGEQQQQDVAEGPSTTGSTGCWPSPRRGTSRRLIVSSLPTTLQRM